MKKIAILIVSLALLTVSRAGVPPYSKLTIKNSKINPAFLLWCTGLRWYAFFVPILIFLLQVPIARNKFYGLSLLSHVTILMQ
jgi:hypothetical protein